MSTTEDEVRDSAIAQYAVIDAPPRPELLALTELAARCAGVPMATINVITATHQWQVATYGIDAAVCSREDSMCSVVLQERTPVLVSDASADERFRGNPFVTGRTASVRFYASHPLTTPDGVVIGTLCVFDERPHPVDPELVETLATLADRVVDVLQLELTSRRLAAANERLGAFAGQVSHDLKNPLAAIRMSVELAREEAGNDDALAPLLERAERGAHRMDAMIGELLTFARGGAPPDRVDVDLGEQMCQVLEDLAGAGAADRVEVGDLPVVQGDPVQLRTVLQNLVANALKFSPPGSPVSVTAVRLPAGWWVGVTDRGPGVPEQDRDRAFEPMVRLDRSKPGSGIGLATCRRVVEAHGGRIGIEDSALGGAAVWFTLPG
ncbi:MAG TPA: GAF domain-containing sensor histidine kinase [Nocardioides sp.]|nr:GAF domain-containing sensor histidine kinase [Nocardioides sp.]